MFLLNKINSKLCASSRVFLHNGSVTNISTESLKSSCVCLPSWSCVSQEGRLVCCLPCPVYPGYSMHRSSARGYHQTDTVVPAGPFSITSFCNNHSLNSNHPGVEQIYSNDCRLWAGGAGCRVSEAWWLLKCGHKPSWAACVTGYWHKWPSSHESHTYIVNSTTYPSTIKMFLKFKLL